MNTTIQKFGFVIKNTSSEAKEVALIPAYFDTKKAVDGEGDIPVLVHSSAEEIIRAGFQVDSVIDDFNSAVKEPAVAYGGIKTATVSRTTSIRSFLEYVKSRALYITEMTVQLRNPLVSVFDQNLQYGELSPVVNRTTQDISLSDYFSVNQQDSTKIVIDMSRTPLKIAYDTLLSMTLPAGADIVVSFKFGAAI